MDAFAAPEPRIHRAICPNCYAQRVPGAQFCHGCGQPAWDRTPTVRQIAREYGVQYVGAEGALWRTLGLLMRPGRLTVEYLHGRRRRYVHPIRLYLTTSVICFLVLQVSATIDASRQPGPVTRGQGGALVLDVGPAAARAQVDGRFECDLPSWICDRLQRRYAVEPQRLQAEMDALKGRFLSYLPYAVFLLVPLFAALMQLAYLGRRMHYAEHLVFALHLHAFWFTALWAAAIAPTPLDVLAAACLGAYGVLAMRRVYGGRWRATLARAAVISPLYLAAMSVATVGVVLVAAIA